MSDIAATWDVALSDKIHRVEFEHGTTTGKRIIRVDNKEVYRQDWMFKLVGKQTFKIGKHTCTIAIDAVSGFAYEYTLEVNGKSLKKFSENQRKIQKAWNVMFEDTPIRVCLEKDTLNVWVHGEMVETLSEFLDGGSAINFDILGHSAYIQAESSGKRKSGIVHTLHVHGPNIRVEECLE